VKTGNSSVTRIQVTGGLAEGDGVAMPSDNAAQAVGLKVTPVIEPRGRRPMLLARVVETSERVPRNFAAAGENRAAGRRF
jgi:hypothetical protein